MRFERERRGQRRPAGRRKEEGSAAPAHLARAQIAAAAATASTIWWVIASDASAIEIANFAVFSAALTIVAGVAAFSAVVARGGKRRLLASPADPIGLLAEPCVSKGRPGAEH